MGASIYKNKKPAIIFLIPAFLFMIVYLYYPFLQNIWNSFQNIRQLGSSGEGFLDPWYSNYVEMLHDEVVWISLKNTLIMWGFNFVPQILVSLLLAVWLTDQKVKVKGTGAVKVIVYLPSIITAASVSVLFKALFSQYGPITQTLKDWGVIAKNFDFMSSVAGSRGLISGILWWMWFGNTTLLLISGVLGIDPGLFEAADIDGATGFEKFRYITLPLLKPIMLYTLVTSAIGGLQMYDIPALFNVPETGLVGLPDDKTTTMAMYIMRLYNSDVGKAAAVSVILFAVTLIVSLILFASMSDKDERRMKKARKAGGKR
mgnify:CR=1 FL=1